MEQGAAPTREENAAAFADEDVVAAYRFRPPYPAYLVERLLALVPGRVGNVLELGCGTGELSRKLAAHVDHVDAVDPSAAMLHAAQALPCGHPANISWIQSSAEKFAYPRSYDLAVAAESIHWMDWDVVLPRLARSMSVNGLLAVVARSEHAPWSDGYREIISTFSVVSDYRPIDVPQELERGGYWHMEGRETTSSVLFRQLVEDYIELQHSRSAFARYRIGPEMAREFDAALRVMLAAHAHDGVVEYEAGVTLAWGRPLNR